MGLPKCVTLRDVGPRDGLQAESVVISTERKRELIRALVASGVKHIEVTSFVHPKAIPQLSDAEAVVAALPAQAGVHYSALVPNRRGAERALQTPIHEVTVFLSATESHNQNNVRQTVAESLTAAQEVAEVWLGADRQLSAVIATSFGCPFEGAVDPSRVVETARHLAKLGCSFILLGDTIGVAQPLQVRDLVRRLQDALPDTRFGLHFHNTRDRALANILAGLEQGIDLFDGSVGGMGGCPYAPGATGNVATEDVADLMEAMGIQTGIDIAALAAVAAEAEAWIGHVLPSAILRVWRAGALQRG